MSYKTTFYFKTRGVTVSHCFWPFSAGRNGKSRVCEAIHKAYICDSDSCIWDTHVSVCIYVSPEDTLAKDCCSVSQRSSQDPLLVPSVSSLSTVINPVIISCTVCVFVEFEDTLWSFRMVDLYPCEKQLLTSSQLWGATAFVLGSQCWVKRLVSRCSPPMPAW